MPAVDHPDRHGGQKRDNERPAPAERRHAVGQALASLEFDFVRSTIAVENTRLIGFEDIVLFVGFR
jgi:hypothetical protein